MPSAAQLDRQLASRLRIGQRFRIGAHPVRVRQVHRRERLVELEAEPRVVLVDFADLRANYERIGASQ